MKKLLTLVIIFMATALSSCKSDDSDVLSDVLSIVHVSKGGTLASVLTESGLDASQLVSLKISGILNAEDFMTIRNMNALINLDISEVEITALPEKAFFGSVNIRHLILPRNLMTIGEKMFYNSGLESIVIPIGVETIETSAFYACSSLRTVTFEEGSQLKTIDGGYNGTTYCGAFTGCTSLISIEIPASVETIGQAAFKNCSKLASVTFEEGSQLKTIDGDFGDGTGAFSDCTSLTSIEIPASVEIIGKAAFKGCSKLANVTFEEGSQLKTIDVKAFYHCTSLTSIEIPASVETIGQAAFKNCSKLASVTFEEGSQLKTIVDDAFSDCVNLMTVDMSECTQVESIMYDAFSNNSKLQLFKIGTKRPPKCYDRAFDGIHPYSILKVPSGWMEYYRRADGWNSFANIEELTE